MQIKEIFRFDLFLQHSWLSSKWLLAVIANYICCHTNQLVRIHASISIFCFWTYSCWEYKLMGC